MAPTPDLPGAGRIDSTGAAKGWKPPSLPIMSFPVTKPKTPPGFGTNEDRKEYYTKLLSEQQALHVQYEDRPITREDLIRQELEIKQQASLEKERELQMNIMQKEKRRRHAAAAENDANRKKSDQESDRKSDGKSDPKKGDKSE
jgi:hypothetical protein